MLRTSCIPQLVGLAAKFIETFPQARYADPSREQHLTNIILGLEDLPSANLKTDMIKIEHTLKERSIRTGKIGC